jgi:hypothetical protein
MDDEGSPTMRGAIGSANFRQAAAPSLQATVAGASPGAAWLLPAKPGALRVAGALGPSRRPMEVGHFRRFSGRYAQPRA